ncbi:MAG: hypothetical protein E7600_07990 [Ruminococcaceae bacterium]|nr:hypothetical protein [Oscillospiraceae bacterium]
MKKVLLTAAFCIVISFISGCVEIEKHTQNDLKEVSDINETMTDEYIIEKFDEAYDVWVSWIYGQFYRAYDNPDDSAFGPSRESVTSESPIQSTAQLREELEKHFTKEMTDKYFLQLKPEDKDGKLYIYTGDVGGPYSGPENITVDKINDTCYRLNLDIWSYMDDGEDMPDQCVYYVFKDSKWVFENDDESEFFYSRGNIES